MSMYSQLIRSALDTRDVEFDAPIEQLHKDLLSLHASLQRTGSEYPKHSREAAAEIAQQLAYDVAMVDLARKLGVACDLSGFDRPEEERLRLRRELSRLGIKVGRDI